MLGYLALLALLIGVAAYFLKFEPVRPKQIESTPIEPETNLREVDMPDLWIGQGVKIIGFPEYVKPPIYIDDKNVEVFQLAEYIEINISGPLQTISIQLKYSQLERYDKDSVLNHLKERKIIK